MPRFLHDQNWLQQLEQVWGCHQMTWPLRKWRLNCHTSTATASRSWLHWWSLVLVLWFQSQVWRACLFTLNYPFLLARSQLISRLPAEGRQSNPSSLPLPLTFGSSIGHVLSFQIWRSARVRRSIVQRSAVQRCMQRSSEMIGRNHDFPW